MMQRTIVCLVALFSLLAQCSRSSDKTEVSELWQVPPRDVVAISILDAEKHEFSQPPDPALVDYFITDPDMIDRLVKTIDWSGPHHENLFARHEIYVYMKESDNRVRRWALKATLDLLTDLDDPEHPSYETRSLKAEKLWRSLAQ